MTSTDERAAREMLGPLAGEPTGEQWLDLNHIVREGGRRRRIRSAATGAFTAVFLTAVAAGTAGIVVNGRQGDGGGPAAGRESPSAAAAPYLTVAPTGPDCTLSPVPWTTGMLAAVDHTGHYTLQEVRSGKKKTVTVRRDGTQVARVEIPNASWGSYHLNAKGDFVALFEDVSTDRQILTSYVYTDGKLTRLTDEAVVNGIADDGRFAGVTKAQVPARWERPDAAPTTLAVHGGKKAQIMFVDRDGTMLGYANTEAAEFATLWLPDGSSRPVPSPAGQRSPVLGGIANGWIVGSDDMEGFRYHVGTKKYEVLPVQARRPHTVAANGAVVGDDGTDGHLWVLNGGIARKLPGTPPAPGTINYRVLGISDDGRTITGNEYFHTGTDPASETGRAVTWTCG